MTGKLYLGIDVGGTSIKSILVNSQGENDTFQSIPTKKEKGPDYVLERIGDIIEQYQKYLAPNVLGGVGIALPGSVDNNKGMSLFSPNLKWNKISLIPIIYKYSEIEVKLINDADAACLGEYFFGNGQGYGNVLCLTLGTGIGSAVIINNHLYRGISGLAPEAGHITVKVDGPLCSCGRRGCLEALVSATAIIRETHERIKKGGSVFLANAEQLSIMEIVGAWEQGDRIVQGVINEVKIFLAEGLANLVNSYNPEVIILGGGVIEAGNFIIEDLDSMVKERVFPTFRKYLQIIPSALGNKAGAVGAACIMFKRINTIGGNSCW